MDIEKKINKLKNLSQYKDYTKEQLKKKVIENIEKKKRKKRQKSQTKQYTLDGDWLEQEQDKAQELFEFYLKKRHLEQESDLFLLKQLIKLEVLQERFQKQINDLERKRETGKVVAIPVKAMETIHENLDQIIKLKEKLGLLEDKEQQEWVIFWKDLLENIDLYVNTGENGVICHLKCPYCGRMYLARKNIKNFELLPHPFFIERNIIYNKKLFNLLHEKRITVEEVAQILDTHSQFIEKLYNKIYLKEKEKESNPNL